jgi:hypothetical protein
MTNYPDDVSASSSTAPWNKRRSVDDITEEENNLRSIRACVYRLASELELSGAANLFSTTTLTQYDHDNPVDMLNAMLDIIAQQLSQLAQQ